MAEECMSRLQCRGSIALAAIVVALLSSRPADAQQIGVDPGPPREPGGLVNNFLTGVQYDIVNQALAEHRLQYLQAKLRRDAERGNTAAVDRDVCQIDNVKARIAMDEWLIRWNSLQNPGFYPPTRITAESRAAIAQATHPIPIFYPSQPVPTSPPGPTTAAPTIPITIVNAEPTGVGVAFVIDGVSHQAAGGSRQELAVATDSNITYESGGSLGQRRYQISPGAYEFRSTAEGWALYKLAAMPGTGDGTQK
jgi:hypothetical protein